MKGLFLMCYGLFRFMMEFVREPDAHIGYQAFGWLTQGQILSAPMIIIGLGIIIWAYKYRPVTNQNKTNPTRNK